MTSFAYAVQVRREDGSEVAQVPVAVDWEPAREALRLAALEQGVGPEAAFLLDTELEPVWHSERGQPFLEGVLGTAPGAGIRRLFPLDYFNDAARSVTRQLISEEKLAKGDLVRCLPVAFAAPAPGAAGTDPAPRSSQGRLLPPRVPLRSGSVEQLAAESSEPATGSLPTFIPETVLQQTAELTARDSGRETGGILIGHLGRDQSTGRLFLEITAQVPAHHTEATSARLTFTPATWTDVRNALTLRNRDEIMLGWWHSHPVREWCRECAPEKRAACALARGFFSEDDRHLHRTMFPRAYSIALVVNDLESGPTWSLFGWDQGTITDRGFARLREVQHARS